MHTLATRRHEHNRRRELPAVRRTQPLRDGGRSAGRAVLVHDDHADCGDAGADPAGPAGRCLHLRRVRRRARAGGPLSAIARAPRVALPLRCWHVYLIECRDGSIYTGVAIDVESRYAAHAVGKGARYTRSHPPRRLLAVIPCADRSTALRLEFAVKRLTAAQKRALCDKTNRA
jgi:putative endonuclease